MSLLRYDAIVRVIEGIVELDHAIHPLDRMETEELREIRRTFTANARRIVSQIELPLKIWTHARAEAAYYNEMSVAKDGEAKQVASEKLNHVLHQENWYSALSVNSFAERDAGTDAALKLLLESMLLSTWTTFEVLAADVWVAAVNCRPKLLAKLSGKKERISKLLREPVDSTSNGEGQSGAKSVPLKWLHEVSCGSYDFSEQMGELLRGRYRFSESNGLLQAYSEAFSEDFASIDRVLSNMAIGALHATRNLLVHQAGVADQIYVDRQKKFPLAPLLQLGEAMSLDGEIVAALIPAVITVCVELLLAADAWIVAH